LLAPVSQRPLWGAVRGPLLVLTVGAVGLLVAVVVDQTSAYEYALTVGAPSLWVLGAGLVWLVVAVVVHVVRRRGRTGSTPSDGI
jgi:hypothetical protein